MSDSYPLQQYKKAVYATARRVQARAALSDVQINEILAKLDIDAAVQPDLVREALRTLQSSETITDGTGGIVVLRFGSRYVLIHSTGVNEFSSSYPSNRDNAITDLLAKVKELGYDWKAVFGPRSVFYERTKPTLSERANDRLADYKQRVYDLAASLKRQYSWCDPSFEEFIVELDIKIEEYNANDLVIDLSNLAIDQLNDLGEDHDDIFVIRQDNRFVVLSPNAVEVLAIESGDDVDSEAAVKDAATKTLAHLRTLVPAGNFRLSGEYDND